MIVPLNLWNVQNSFLDACKDLPQNKPEYRELYQVFAREIDIPPEVIILGGRMKKEFEALAKGDHYDPHRILGGHPYQHKERKGVIVRAFHPDAVKVSLLLEGRSLEMSRIHPGGIFEADLDNMTWPFSYRLLFAFEDGNHWETEDPYRFPPTLGDMDLHLFNEGNHLRLV